MTRKCPNGCEPSKSLLFNIRLDIVKMSFIPKLTFNQYNHSQNPSRLCVYVCVYV